MVEEGICHMFLQNKVLTCCQPYLKVTSGKGSLSTKDITKFNTQYPTLSVKTTTDFHDRFLIIDKAEVYIELYNASFTISLFSYFSFICQAPFPQKKK